MSITDDHPFGVTLVIFFMFAVVMISGWVISSAFEAEVFEEATGRHVTLKQAMFLKLRVIECSTNQESQHERIYSD